MTEETPEPAPAPDEAATLKNALDRLISAEAIGLTHENGQDVLWSRVRRADIDAICKLAPDHIASLTTRLAEAEGRVEELEAALIYLVNAHEHPMASSRTRPGVLDHVPAALKQARAALSGKG